MKEWEWGEYKRRYVVVMASPCSNPWRTIGSSPVEESKDFATYFAKGCL